MSGDQCWWLLILSLPFTFRSIQNVNGMLEGRKLQRFPEELLSLMSQLPQLNPEVGRRVLDKFVLHIIALNSGWSERTSQCPSRLTNILTNHMICPLTVEKAYPYLKIADLLGHQEIIKSIVHGDCNRLSGTLEEGCKFIFSKLFEPTQLLQVISNIIDECYTEHMVIANTSLSFK